MSSSGSASRNCSSEGSGRPVFRAAVFRAAVLLLAAVPGGCALKAPPSPAPAESGPPGAERAAEARAVVEAPLELSLLLRLTGEARGGELGFRFGPPRDVDGDGIADIAAGARFTNLEFTGMGTVAVWSSGSGRQIAYWEGHAQDALFGHSVLIGPDADRDGHPDIIASAPNGKYHEVYRGVIYARSAATGRLLWSVVGETSEGIGWHLALAGDQNRDGTADIFAGLPGSGVTGKVYLLSGRDGAVLRSFASSGENDQFGWYADAVPDLDGDGLDDLIVGAPSAQSEAAGGVGAAYIYSSAKGNQLRAWHGRQVNGQFGEVVCALPDLDGDGAAELAVAAPYRPLSPEEEPLPGEVFVFSGASGGTLRHWVGRQRGELYGRMVASAGDADGDGVGDIAVAAPWYGAGGREKAGRFELRSGRSGEILAAVEGEREGMWLGWHMVPGENLGREQRRGLVVSALRSEENGLPAAGAIIVYLYGRR
jgi:hypothetical protein